MMSVLTCQRLSPSGSGTTWAAFDCFAFHRHVDLDVLACGGDADVTEPRLDHVEFDAGLEYVQGAANLYLILSSSSCTNLAEMDHGMAGHSPGTFARHSRALAASGPAESPPTRALHPPTHVEQPVPERFVHRPPPRFVIKVKRRADANLCEALADTRQ